MTSSPPLPVPTTAPPDEVLREVLERLDGGDRVALATVVRRRGSTPSTPGQKLALFTGGGAVGTVGGGAVEQRVMGVMAEVLAAPRPEARIETYDLGPALGMCCGGAVDVLVEVLDPALCVLVVGAGHVGKATAPLLASLGFRVTLCDGRAEIAQDEARPGSGPVEPSPRLGFLHADHDDPGVFEALGSEPQRAAALVMTHDHQLDHTVIEWALTEGFAFVGGVGSRAKAKRTRQRLTAIELARADIERVRMPLGVDIGARTPAEIAVSIAGELIAWRAGLLDQ
ncbi:MAG: XdhC family protein [Deltaproteobacteria bacterium]|nr:XdhC family protein [Deltaproteobacteria bacterium]